MGTWALDLALLSFCFWQFSQSGTTGEVKLWKEPRVQDSVWPWSLVVSRWNLTAYGSPPSANLPVVWGQLQMELMGGGAGFFAYRSYSTLMM